MLEDAEVQCPCCWETIVLELDLSAGSQIYTEDCPVCCRPMRVQLDVDADGRWQVDVASESD
jgi:hypothetical protein